MVKMIDELRYYQNVGALSSECLIYSQSKSNEILEQLQLNFKKVNN